MNPWTLLGLIPWKEVIDKTTNVVHTIKENGPIDELQTKIEQLEERQNQLSATQLQLEALKAENRQLKQFLIVIMIVLGITLLISLTAIILPFLDL